MELSCEMLLHPELLSNHQLIHVIQERHLKIPNLNQMERSDLLEVFHHYCVPYGQRKYRDSGRGKLLNKTRNISQDSPPKLNTSFGCENARKTAYFNNCERLKPPPDTLSGHMKRIKIESKTVNTNIDHKRKMSVEEQTDEYQTPKKKEKKPITWP